MCGRFANKLKDRQQWAEMLNAYPFGAETGFNIAPSQSIPVVTAGGGQAMRWGMIPPWAKEVSGKFSTFNARIESVDEKPGFRHAWKQKQRCLIPILGYYEWQAGANGKQPFFIHPKDESPLMLAGLWEPAHHDLPASCTILTTDAHPTLAKIHHRMPVFVSVNAARSWLDGTAKGGLSELYADWPGLEAYPVSTAVNNPRSQGQRLLERAATKPM